MVRADSRWVELARQLSARYHQSNVAKQLILEDEERTRYCMISDRVMENEDIFMLRRQFYNILAARLQIPSFEELRADEVANRSGC